MCNVHVGMGCQHWCDTLFPGDHQKKEVSEQNLVLYGERVCLWKSRGLNVLFHPQGFGLFRDLVMYMLLVI